MQTCPPATRKIPEVLCGETIYRRMAPAVVGLTVVPNFKIIWSLVNKYFEQVNGESLFNAGIIPMSMSGFFLKTGHFASTSAFTALLTAASLVMTFSVPYCWKPGTNQAHPAFNAFCKARYDGDGSTPNTNKYSNLPGFVDVLRDLCTDDDGSSIASWFEFLVDVCGVQGRQCAATYKAYLSGLDFETSVATFKIDANDEWNRNSLAVTHQRFLKFGNSKNCCPGSEVHTIYDSKVTGPCTFRSGVVSNNAALIRDGSVTYEIIATTLHVAEGAEGAPILNSCGQVVGIVTGRSKDGLAFGVSSAFAERIINALVDGACNPGCTPHSVISTRWGCQVYRHGDFPWQYHTASAIDLNQAALRLAVEDEDCSRCSYGVNCGGPACGNEACNGTGYYRNRFYSYENASINKFYQGIILDTDPCGKLANSVETCNITSINYGPPVTRFYRLEKGDKVTKI
eukprot:Lithocolla_globosa_v1_NODE_3_length_14236_cov_22.745998.p3 type:complete len:456 gc:universal NODE_3_length_14236_cov_22.745998:6334-4967(-)